MMMQSYGSGPSLEEYKQVVESRCGCTATLHRIERLRYGFGGRVFWEGDVYVYDLSGHPTAEIAFAWAELIPGSDRNRIHAVLQTEQIQSAPDAVQAVLRRD